MSVDLKTVWPAIAVNFLCNTAAMWLAWHNGNLTIAGLLLLAGILIAGTLWYYLLKVSRSRQ